MPKRLALCLALALGLGAQPALAQLGENHCEVKPAANTRGWIPDWVLFLINEETNAVMVDDPIIRAFGGKPIAAKISSDTEVKITYSWVVEVKDSRNQYAHILYRAVITKATKALALRAIVQGYRDTFTGTGHCTLKPAS